MTTQADRLALTLPIHRLTTNKFGITIPEVPLKTAKVDEPMLDREFRSDDGGQVCYPPSQTGEGKAS